MSSRIDRQAWHISAGFHATLGTQVIDLGLKPAHFLWPVAAGRTARARRGRDTVKIARPMLV